MLGSRPRPRVAHSVLLSPARILQPQIAVHELLGVTDSDARPRFAIDQAEQREVLERTVLAGVAESRNTPEPPLSLRTRWREWQTQRPVRRPMIAPRYFAVASVFPSRRRGTGSSCSALHRAPDSRFRGLPKKIPGLPSPSLLTAHMRIGCRAAPALAPESKTDLQ